ncbi:MAG: MBOAT family protein [Clostridiales Family XIII bacterium]|jgi:alginate O-acetyltransferase complex protein AlgI|nr:MBOAT family protein [Clostridiales Family XIII bacterium]
MLFTSQIFVVCFLPAVLILYYTVFKWSRLLQNIFLLLASLVFYGWGEPWFILVLLVSIAVNWLFGVLAAVSRGHKIAGRAVLALMLTFNLTLMFIFKYLMFTLENINSFFGTDYYAGEIVLPIGISFFTFQAISYVVDVYRNNGQLQKNPFYAGLYIAFFPQLVAGPIIRYESISGQIRFRKESLSGFSKGVTRFLMGFAKKILLANNLSLVADQAFSLNDSGGLSVLMAWLGALSYTMQIYFDFSGYSDMAIGLGRMFGFRFPENFNYPYIAKSTSEFWRRWHISLGAWFRDYLYFPLGGSRVRSKLRLVFNLFVVWLLTGLWHGANWTFICWGLMYFLSISLEKLSGFAKWGASRELIWRRFFDFLRHCYTMLVVMFGWVLFRAESFEGASSYIRVMTGRSDRPFADNYGIGNLQEYAWFFMFGILFSTPVAPWLWEKIRIALVRRGKTMRFPEFMLALLYAAALIIIFIASFSYLVKGSYNPFIYYNF